MDLITLNENNQESKLIENYDSLVWTERFNTVGDFVLTTGNVDWFMANLPEGKRLSLRESNHVMVVETHKIERPKNQGAKLTITGRSFESILDRRASVRDLAGSKWLVSVKKPSDTAYYAMTQVCVNGILSQGDRFPSSMVVFPTPSDYLAGNSFDIVMEIPAGNLLETVLQLLQMEAPANNAVIPNRVAVLPHGIRAVRPNSSGTAIAIEIYLGVDRSESVYFDATRSLLDDGTYLFSKVGSANIAYLSGQGVSGYLTAGGTEQVGLERRVIWRKSNDANTAELLGNEGSMELSQKPVTALFDGSINQDVSPYIYGRDYNLGDVVRLVGDYGMETKARVTEFIRSVDATGRKAYPTLSAIQQ